MAGTVETKIERMNPSVAMVDAESMTVKLSDRATFQQVVRHLDERGVILYQEANK